MASAVKLTMLDIAVQLSVLLVKTLDRYILVDARREPYMKAVRQDALELCTTLIILRAEKEGERIDENNIVLILATHGINAR